MSQILQDRKNPPPLSSRCAGGIARRRREILGISESKVVLLEQIRPFRATFLDLKSPKFPACGGLDLSIFLSSVQQNTNAISKIRAEKLEKISACGGLDLSTFLSSVQQNTKAISKNRAEKLDPNRAHRRRKIFKI